jgi:hypothetical protein
MFLIKIEKESDVQPSKEQTFYMHIWSSSYKDEHAFVYENL